MKFLYAFVILALALASPTMVTAQIKVDGPKEGTVGYRVKAKLTLDVADPIIKCIPANDDWYAVQDLAGNKFIDFVPGRSSIPDGQDTQTYTFIVAGSLIPKAPAVGPTKTCVEIYTVIVKHDTDYVPPTPGPKPAPQSSQLYKDILAAYKVSPNASALTLLRTNFAEFQKECETDKYTSASVAGKALADKFKNKDLQSVRDVITTYLGATAGNTWNKAKVVAALTEINRAISAVPE